LGTATWAASTPVPAAPAALLAAFRQEVLRDLRLVVVAILVVRARADGRARRAGRDAELALPDRSEGRVLWQRCHLLLEELVLDEGFLDRLPIGAEGDRCLAFRPPATTASAATSPTPAAAALALLGVATDRDPFLRPDLDDAADITDIAGLDLVLVLTSGYA
jgi:hypothetical protein